MRKIRIFAAGILFLIQLLTGCSVSNEQTSERTELEYTVMEIRSLPQELQEIVEEHKKEEMRMSYTDGSDLYLIRGYGEQQSGGYSIAILECSEDETSILLDTQLLGPENPEELKDTPSWPYLVIKTENTGEKEVKIQ